MPAKMQTMHEDKVASKSNASVPSRARERSPDAAPSLRRTIRDNKHCAPCKYERKSPRAPCRRASPQEDTSASQTNWPTATVRQLKRGPRPDFSPTSDSLPADGVRHGPNNSKDDTRAETTRARGPRSKRARLDSRQGQLKVMGTRKGPPTRPHGTPGVGSINFPEGDSGAEKPVGHLSQASHDKSGPSGLGSRTTIPNPNRKSETTSEAKSATTVQTGAMTMRRHKQCKTKRREERMRIARVKTNTVIAEPISARQSGRDARDQRRRDAIPLARPESKLRQPILLGDPIENYARTPPAARRETPFGEYLGACLRTPASASYEEHDYEDRGRPDRYVRYDLNHASKLRPGGSRGSGRQRDTRAEHFRFHYGSPSREPQSNTQRPKPHHRRCSRGEEMKRRAKTPRRSRFKEPPHRPTGPKSRRPARDQEAKDQASTARAGDRGRRSSEWSRQSQDRPSPGLSKTRLTMLLASRRGPKTSPDARRKI